MLNGKYAQCYTALSRRLLSVTFTFCNTAGWLPPDEVVPHPVTVTTLVS